jgi:hypothetical protein
MSYDATPFYGLATFPENRFDGPLKPIMGILYERNAPRITLNDTIARTRNL